MPDERLIQVKVVKFYLNLSNSIFAELDSREKWTSYKFTKNVYEIWMPTHFERICSVIDMLPSDLDFEISEQSEPGESGLSQGLESHHLSD